MQAEVRGWHDAEFPHTPAGVRFNFLPCPGGVASLRHRLISGNASGVRMRLSERTNFWLFCRLFPKAGMRGRVHEIWASQA